MNNKPLGEIFSDKLKGLEKQPSPHVWSSIESKLGGITPQYQGFSSLKTFLISTIVVVSSATIGYFIYNHFSEKTPIIKEQKLLSRNQNQEKINIVKNNNDANAIVEYKDKTTPKIKKKKDADKANTNNTIVPVIEENIKSEKPDNNYPISNPQLKDENPIIESNEKVIEKILPETTQNNETNKPKAIKERVPITFDNDKHICKGTDVTLRVAGGESYLWSNGATSDSITVKPPSSTFYTVAVTDEYGRKYYGSINVKVTDCNLYLPNAFSPNGDGVLDNFKPAFKDVKSYHLMIFSRNGDLVFETKDSNQAWDGSFKGNTAPVGAYIYIIKYVNSFDEHSEVKGFVTLIR